MSSLQIQTDRLVLRRMQLDDAPALHRILSDPEAMRYWSTLPHERLETTTAWVAASVASAAAGEADEFVMLSDGAVIGKAGLWKGNEIGILLSRDRWGQGYGAEALRAIIDHVFGKDTAAIVADIDPRNTASSRLFRKLGFRQTGWETATFLLGGVWADSLYFTLTSADWLATRHPRGPIEDRPA